MTAPRKTVQLAESRRILTAVQQELAKLMFEPGSMDSFELNAGRHLKSAHLPPRAATLLRDLPVPGARFFAERRRIDRHHYLKGDLPRTMTHLDAIGRFHDFLDAHPFAKEAPQDEAEQLVLWLDGAGLPGPLVDLARIELAGLRLFDEAHRMLAPGANPRWPHGMQILSLQCNPDEILGPQPLAAASEEVTVAVIREPEDVEVYRLSAVEVQILEICTGRRNEGAVLQQVAKHVGLPAAKKAFVGLVRRGLLVPSARKK